MSEDFTPKLGLPYVLPDQAQKHVTVNESLSRVDSLIMGSLVGRNRQIPPEAPAEGDAWLIGDAPQEAWSGWAGAIAVWRDATWLRLVPQTGWRFWLEDEALLIFYDGISWSTLTLEAQELDFIGLGARADTHNPLLARLNSALFTARETAETGNGDIRLTLNKQSAGNICALAMQTGYSGRLEMGLLGNDELRVKLSDTGSDWHDAVIMVPDTGRVGLGTYPDGDTQCTIGGRVRIKSDTTAFTLHEAGRFELSRAEGGAVSVQAVSAGSALELGAVAEDGSWLGAMLALNPDGPELISAHTLRPIGSGIQDLGTSEQAWRRLYLDTAPVLNADPVRQTGVSDLQGAISFLQALQPVSYRKPDSNRLYFGFTAENVQAALNGIGLSEAGLLESGDIPGLRSSELIAVLVSAVQSLETRLARIEQIARAAGLL